MEKPYVICHMLSSIDGKVTGIKKETEKEIERTECFNIELADGSSVSAKTVILAMGAEHSKLGVQGEKEYTGKGVSYCATCDGAFYKGKRVVVVGGGDVALEDAIYLSKLAEKVYIIHRRDTFRGAKLLQDKVLSTANIEFIKDSIVTGIAGETVVETVTISNVKDGSVSKLAVDGVFVAIGMKPDTELVRGLVDMDEKGYICASEDGVTSMPGIFVAGDARTKKLRQVITAVSDGANCITSVEEYLNDKNI